MAVNHMAEVAKMFGVELCEEFEIVFPNPSCHATAFFDENGLVIKNHNLANQDFWEIHALTNLLKGTYTIQSKPRRPKEDEDYWYVDGRGDTWSTYWVEHADNMNYYKLGNCYRTEEEAEANRDKWVAFYESDEVLEV